MVPHLRSQDCRWKKAKERGAYGRSSKRQVANFKFSNTCDAWQAELVGNPKDRSQIAKGMKLSESYGARQWRWRSDTVTLQQTDEGNLLFKGLAFLIFGCLCSAAEHVAVYFSQIWIKLFCPPFKLTIQHPLYEISGDLGSSLP